MIAALGCLPDCALTTFFIVTPLPCLPAVIYDHRWLPDDTLGLDHVDKSSRASRAGPGNGGIVIRS